MVVPYMPVLQPTPMVMLPALPVIDNAVVRAVRAKLVRKMEEEDKHKMKIFLD